MWMIINYVKQSLHRSENYWVLHCNWQHERDFITNLDSTTKTVQYINIFYFFVNAKYMTRLWEVITLTKFVIDVEGAVLNSPIGVVNAETPAFGASDHYGFGLATHCQQRGNGNEN